MGKIGFDIHLPIIVCMYICYVSGEEKLSIQDIILCKPYMPLSLAVEMEG